MRAPSFPTRAVAFHALALVAFLGCAAGLVREARALTGRMAMLELGVAVAAGVVALLALLALTALLRARALVGLESRAPAGTYLQVLGATGVLVLIGVQLVSDGTRPALGAFCLVLAGWLAMMGLHLVPALLLSAEGFVDHLGKRTRFADLEWFELRRTGDEPPRTVLRAGRGQQLHLHTRLAEADPEPLRQVLVRAGLSATSPSSSPPGATGAGPSPSPSRGRPPRRTPRA